MSNQITGIKIQTILRTIISRVFVLSLILIHFSFTSSNPSEHYQHRKTNNRWNLIKNSDGIQVYARPYKNTKHRELKAIGIFNTSVSSLVAVIKDDKAVPDWINRMKLFKNIKVLSTYKWYTYAELSLPFPYYNRDLISLNTLTQKNNKVIIRIESQPAFLPKKRKKVRIKDAEGRWEFHSLGNGKVRVIYQFYAQPNLGLPTWIINPLATKGVYNTLKNFRKISRKAKYQQAKLHYLRQ